MEERELVYKPDDRFPLGIYTGDTISYRLAVSKEMHEGVVRGITLWTAERGQTVEYGQWEAYPKRENDGNLRLIPYVLREPWNGIRAWQVDPKDIEAVKPCVPMTEEGQLLMF